MTITVHYSTLQWVCNVNCTPPNVLQCTAMHCNALLCKAMHCYALLCTTMHCIALQYTAMHCSALQCTAIHYYALLCTTMHFNALQCTAMHCSALKCTAMHCNARQCAAIHGNTRQRTATHSHCNLLQHKDFTLHMWVPVMRTASRCNTLQHIAIHYNALLLHCCSCNDTCRYTHIIHTDIQHATRVHVHSTGLHENFRMHGPYIH